MGIVINQKVIRGAAYSGRLVDGMAYYGRLVWRANVVEFSIEPDNFLFDNAEYQELKKFTIIAPTDWGIEEIF